MKKLFNTAFYIANHEKPFSDFPGLLKLQSKNFDCKLDEHYCNDKQAKTFISYIAEDMKRDLRLKIKENDFFGLISDGATDTGINEEETVHVRLLDENFKPTTRFLAMKKMAKCDAAGIKAALVSAIEIDGQCPNWRESLTNVTVDGAPVMIGAVSGAVTRMRQDDCPHLLGFHCANHRLELAVKYAAKNISIIESIEKTLQELYKFYHYSPLNYVGLKLSADALNVKVQKPVNIMGSRWVSYRERALQVLEKNWLALVQHMDQVIIEGKGDKASKARGFVKTLTTLQIIVWMKILIHIFPKVTSLSLLLQNNQSTLETLTTKMTATLGILRDFKAVDKIRDILQQNNIDLEDTFYENREINLISGRGRTESVEAALQQVAGECQKFVECLVNNLESKFSNLISNDSMISNFIIFDPKLWPEEIDQHLQYGQKQLKALVNHFRLILGKKGFNPDLCAQEWAELLIHCSHMSTIPPCNELWPRLLKEEKSLELPKFRNVLALVNIMLVLAVSSAEAERCFSLMGRVKSDWRSNLESPSLNDLIAIRLSSVSDESFDPMPAITLWWEGGKKPRRMVDRYGPHKKTQPSLLEEEGHSGLVESDESECDDTEI